MAGIYTIGYGSRDLGSFIALLKTHHIQYLIDVRSKPYSFRNPVFSRSSLETALVDYHIKYVFMGDLLGGRPNDPDCYTSDGHVNYDVYKTKPFFQKGIERLRNANSQGLNIALMCSEAKPQECHRSKLIGEALADLEFSVIHIDEKGALKTHAQVLRHLVSGMPQKSLFGDELPHKFTSRKAYSIPVSGDRLIVPPNQVPSPTKPTQVEKKHEIVTIGVYGFTEQAFFEALLEAKIEVFCDIRMRRGMRGKQYTFVNSSALQEKLKQLDIHYIHMKDLAPTTSIRQHQKDADRTNNVLKRDRKQLGFEFSIDFERDILSLFDSESFLLRIGGGTKRAVLFCVEQLPEACHRSLVAQKISHELNWNVRHILP